MSQKLSVQSPNLTEETLDKLRQLIPSAFCDGELNFDLLKEALGTFEDDKQERYEFTWAGKAEAKRAGQPGTSSTLHPCPEESKNWDTTQNLYIEGDNLEVLKCLSNAYSGKIKMIYIDPPYNTGNDFVYKDNYKEPLKAYEQQTGQADEEGHSLTTNKDTDGRYHTNWLNMMYPRLMLAQRLLTDDGVIFISIDDNEQANLKKICDEVFGAENFRTNIIWQSTAGSNTGTEIITVTENVLIYTKNKVLFNFDGKPLNEENYTLSDQYEKERGKYSLDKLDRRRVGNHYSEALNYPITMPDGSIRYPGGGKEKSNEGWNYLWSKTKVDWGIKNDFIEFKQNNGEWSVYNKRYSKIDNEGNLIERTTSYRNLITSDFYNTAQGTSELRSLFNLRVFDFPKPSNFIKHLLLTAISKNSDSIILDFFSGSATTAHAVMQLNAEDGGKRKFIMVQLPEVCDEKSEAAKAGYKNICEIGKERIRRAGEKIKSDNPLATQDLDIGFRVFKLGASNMKDWELADKPLDALSDLDKQIVKALETAPATIKPGADELSVVYEWLLKRGFMLDTKLVAKTVCGKTVYVNESGEIMICLAQNLTIEWAQGLADLHKSYKDAELWHVIVSWAAFGNDEKTRDANLRNVEQCLTANGLNSDCLTIV